MFRMVSGKIILIAMLALTGCASNKTNEAASKPVIKSIAVIPVSDPTEFSLKNRNALTFIVSPLVGVGTDIDSHDKAKVFTEQMKGQNYPLGQNLTNTLVEALNKQGYKAKVLQGISRPDDDPDDIEYESLKTDADVVLHVYFRNVGVYSGYGTMDYLPRVNVEAYLFNPKDLDQEFYDEEICYGVDGREGKSWSVTADPKFAYRSFDELISKAPEVMAGFDVGAQAVGGRIADNIKSALQ